MTAASADGPSFLRLYAETLRFSLGTMLSPQVTRDGRHVLFLRSGPRDRVQDLHEFDVAASAERRVLGAADLLGSAAEELSAEERARRERQRMHGRGLVGFRLSPDGARVLLPLSGRLFVLDRASGAVRELPAGPGPHLDPRWSPAGDAVAFARDGDLFLLPLDAGAPRRLTARSGPDHSFGTAEFVAQEEMGRFEGYWFSPDGARLLVQETDESEVERVHLADLARPEREPTVFRYPRAGRANARVGLVLVDPSGGAAPVPVTWDRERYPYLAAARWDAGGPPLLVVQERRQRAEAVLEGDPATGATRVLLEETDPAWLRLHGGLPRRLPDGAFLWMTDRHGPRRLERRGADGGLLRSLAPDGANLRRLVHVDGAAGVAWCIAGPDPTEEHLWRVPLEEGGDGAAPVTAEPGVHGAAFGPDGLRVEDHRDPAGRVRHRVVRGDGTVAGEIRCLREPLPHAPAVEWARVGGGAGFHAAVLRPAGFERGRRYPVLVRVYGGPGHQTVMKDGARFALDRWLAGRGFVVVSADGRGTPARGRDWERALCGDFATVPLEDQAAALRALAAERPEMDLDRAGILGWSYGGFMAALAVLRMPELFRAAVAGAPVTAWGDYDTHYTERYAGLPDENREGYARSDLLPLAAGLRRPLLLIHGTADDNVHFRHTLRLSDALFRAGAAHEVLPLAGEAHGPVEPVLVERMWERVAAFFREHLGA